MLIPSPEVIQSKRKCHRHLSPRPWFLVFYGSRVCVFLWSKLPVFSPINSFRSVPFRADGKMQPLDLCKIFGLGPCGRSASKLMVRNVDVGVLAPFLRKCLDFFYLISKFGKSATSASVWAINFVVKNGERPLTVKHLSLGGRLVQQITCLDLVK